MIPLQRALRLGEAPQIAFVGAGGKSTALFILARQFKKSVLVTTSTHLSDAQAASGDLQIALQSKGDVESLDAGKLPKVTIATGPFRNGVRVGGPDSKTLHALSDLGRKGSIPLLIEADGARLRALKAPAEHEPAIPEFVDAVIVVAGLSGLGKPLNHDSVHRPERFAELSELKIGDEITSGAMLSVLHHETGGLKNIPKGAQRILLLNQADSPELEATARRMARDLLSAYNAIWIGALQKTPFLAAVFEPVAGILLAAGESKRFGQPKALLDWRGKPFVRHAAETALSAGLEPVIVVTGPEAGKVEEALAGIPIKVVHNSGWQQGQSSSVKIGLAALPARTGAAIFLVVDQPQLPAALIESLTEEHAASLAPIISPMVDDHRANPVLFDRITFTDFESLQGDVGGRAIFSRHAVRWLPWVDSSLALDVDTPEDYQRLLKLAG